jgi:hypothetical protein
MAAAGRVALTQLLGGFEAAAERFYAAGLGDDADATFRPLFESLHWAVSLDDRLQATWKTTATNPAEWWSDGFIHGDDVKGVRHARHRVHHQWADALYLTGGAQFPMTFPFTFHEWRWRPDLPPGRDDRLKGEYDLHLAATPVRITLGNLTLCFHDAAGELGDRIA